MFYRCIGHQFLILFRSFSMFSFRPGAFFLELGDLLSRDTGDLMTCPAFVVCRSEAWMPYAARRKAFVWILGTAESEVFLFGQFMKKAPASPEKL